MGVVEDMGMRITRLRDDSGRLVILANGDVSSVVNHSRGPLRCSVDVSLPRETDLAALSAQLAATAPAPGGPLLESPALAGITALDAGTLTVRVAAAAQPDKQQEAEMLLREKIHSATRPEPPRAQ
jgi:small-conductance mechanosensitive channel